MLEAQHRFSDGASLRSRQAHNADATVSSRGGNGDDGVVKVHARIVAGKTGPDQPGALVLDPPELAPPTEMTRNAGGMASEDCDGFQGLSGASNGDER